MKLASYFETKTRSDGSAFVRFKDDAPEFLLAAIRDAHQGDLPNDWIWRVCFDVCIAIDTGVINVDEGEWFDDCHGFANQNVEIYTRKLFQWLADVCLTTTFAQASEDADDVGTEDSSIEGRVRLIQYFAIRRIAEIVCKSVADHLVSA